METDEQLLTRWTRQRDPAAFAGLAERHVGLVYGTCRRITGDHHVAEDLAQDVLLELAQQARRVRRSVAGFLHAAARTRALNHLRDERVRQRHEQAAGGVAPVVTVEPMVWQDLEPRLDAALADLDQAERTVLLLHFLEGRSQVEIAELLGTTQATVSRRIARGLETLRTRLAGAGLVLTLAGLSDLCAAYTAEAAPPAVLAAAPKITLAAAGAMAGTTAASGLWLIAGSILMASVLVAGTVLVCRSTSHADVPPVPSVSSRASAPAVTGTPVHSDQTTMTPGIPTMSHSDDAQTVDTTPPGPHTPSTVKPGPFVLKGNGQNRDSVALALVAAGQAFGKTVDYTEATCRLGNAFAPGIDRQEDCTSHMQVEGRLLDRNLPAAAAALGLHGERIAFPDRIGSADDAAVRLRHRQTAAAEVLRLQAAGRLVLVSGGWEIGGPHGFRHWAYAGILTSADPATGMLLGAHLQGGQDNPLRFICQTGYEAAGTGLYAWALAPAATAKADDLATLRVAVDRIRGQGLFADDGRDVFGLAAMDWWITLMRRDAGFCAPCWEGRQAGKIPWDAHENAMRMRRGAQAAAGFLRGCGSRLPVAARPHLDQAAACYDRIASLLALAVAKDGPGCYQAFLGDLAQQQRHADEVLVPVRAALEEAAGHLERALAAEAPPAAVRRDGDRVVIEGVPGEKRVEGIWHLDGLPASLRAVFASKGVDPVFLDDTIFAAILGQPFRFWFSEDFSSCLAYTVEVPLGVMAAETLGFTSVWHPGGFAGVKGEDVERGRAALAQGPVDEAWAQVSNLLTQGHPVVVFGGQPTRNRKDAPSVLVGFTKDGSDVYALPHATWDSAPAWDDGDPTCVAGIKEQGYRTRPRPDQTNWIGSGFAPGQGMGGSAACFFAVTDRLRTPTRHEVAVAVLRRALAIGRGEAFDRQRPGIKGGLVGLDLLAKSLAHAPMNRHRDPDWWYAMEGLAWPGYRRTAAAFLTRCAADFGTFTEGQKVHLRSAAEAYGESSRQFESLWRHFSAAGGLEGYEERVATVARVLASPELGAQAAAIVEGIIVAEKRALDEIAAALADQPMALRDGGRVVIDGVPTLAWGKGRECTYAGALEAALKVTARPYSYDDLMGYSGLAFRVRWFTGHPGQQRWCPSSPCGEVRGPIEAVSRATGWRQKVHLRFDGQPLRDLGPEVMTSIDRGLPALAYDAEVNVAVVYGYQADGTQLLLCGYDGLQTVALDQLRIQALLLADGGDPLPRQEATLASLRLAPASWRSTGETYGAKGTYLFGPAALRRWADDLGVDVDALPTSDRELLFFVSWWTFTSLVDARDAAVRFLTAHRDDLDATVRNDLDRVNACYRASALLLNEAKAGKDAFLGPWSGRQIDDWSPEVRAREREILTQVAAIEEQAVTILEGILADQTAKP